MENFRRYVGIDWSGAKDRHDQRIYVASARREDDQSFTLETVTRAADRMAVIDFLRGKGLRRHPAWEDDRQVAWPAPDPIRSTDGGVVVGLDFAFGFPATFRPEGKPDWGRNDLYRFVKKMTKAKVLDKALKEHGQFRFDGREMGSQVAEPMRETDRRIEHLGIASVFRIYGQKQVGKASIHGIAMLADLKGFQDAQATDVHVWPFDGHVKASEEKPVVVLVEVFPRLWLGDVNKSHMPGRICALDPVMHEGNLVYDTRHRGSIEERSVRFAVAETADALDAITAVSGLTRAETRLEDLLQVDPAEIAESSRVDEGPGQILQEGWIIGVDYTSSVYSAPLG